MKNLISITFLFCLAGCASSSGIVPLGPDTYFSSKQAGSGFSGLGTMQADLLKEAAAFCAKENKFIRVNETKQVPGGVGTYPYAELHFMCLEKGDPELTRPKEK